MKSLILRLKKRADRALSLYIRAKTKNEYKICPFCKIRPIQVCFHFIPKKNQQILRWREDNVIGACRDCNFDEQHFPDPYRLWFIDKIGLTRYRALVTEAVKGKDFEPTIEYLQNIIVLFQKKLEDLNAKQTC